MGARNTYFKEMDASISAGALRAAQYNIMLKQIGLALEKWTVMLTHDQRKEIYDALDWYHTNPRRATGHQTQWASRSFGITRRKIACERNVIASS